MQYPKARRPAPPINAGMTIFGYLIQVYLEILSNGRPIPTHRPSQAAVIHRSSGCHGDARTGDADRTIGGSAAGDRPSSAGASGRSVSIGGAARAGSTMGGARGARSRAALARAGFGDRTREYRGEGGIGRPRS